MRRHVAIALVAVTLLSLVAPAVALATPTATSTGTPTGTPTGTATNWSGGSLASTPAPTPSPTATATSSPTPTATPTATATPTTTTSEPDTTREWTLAELKRDGPHQSNSPPGVRMGDRSQFWAVYWPANNPFASVGSSEGGKFMPAGHTVGRNKLFLRTWTYENRQETVHVVYWERGQETVQRGNTSQEVATAQNVTHVTHEVTFQRGRPTVEIPLRQHDTPVQATMWIEGHDWARWRFQHHSIATTQSVAIDSAGDYLSALISDVLIWIVIGGFVVGVAAKKALDRAGIGPQYGYLPWVIVLSVATALGALLAFQSLADLVVKGPIVLAGYVVGIFGIILLETYTSNVSKALFLRPTLEHSQSPTGEDAWDILDAEASSQKVVRDNAGEVAVVKPGLLPFLARVFGKNARLENIEDLRTRVPLKNSKWDELFIADPEADTLIDYDPEGWTLSAPPLSREYALQYVAVGGAVLIATAAFASGAASGPALAGATLLGLLGWTLTPVDGEAAVEPAPVHIRSAMGTMVRLTEDVDDAKRFDEVREQLDKERISKQRDVDREVAQHDATLVEGMLDPDEDVPAVIERAADDEHLQHRDEETRIEPSANGAGGDDD